MEDEKLIALLDERFAKLETNMNARFDGVDARFDRVESRLDRVETRLDGVETRLDGVESGLARVNSEVGKLRVEAHEHTVRLQRTHELMQAVDEKVGRFREETAANFVDVEETINVASRAILKRIRPLEKKAS